MQLRFGTLDLILNTIITIKLVKNKLVVVLTCQVRVFKEFKAKGSQRGFKSEVNKGKLSLRISNYVAIYTKNQLQLRELSVIV